MRLSLGTRPSPPDGLKLVDFCGRNVMHRWKGNFMLHRLSVSTWRLCFDVEALFGRYAEHVFNRELNLAPNKSAQLKH
jgi:hypothetical protein